MAAILARVLAKEVAVDGDAQGFVEGLNECFVDLPDPRHKKSCDLMLLDLLAISVLAVACGADDWCDMAMFAKVKLAWLKTFLELPGGALSHDTFRRVDQRDGLPDEDCGGYSRLEGT